MPREALAFTALLFALSVVLAMRVATGGAGGSDDAYVALGASEADLPSGAQRERLLTAWASVEEPAPEGIEKARVHRFGTLMRVRYDVETSTGGDLGAYVVRALVPPLPQFGTMKPEDPVLGLMGCPEECRERERKGALILARGGRQSLASEWLLRAPLGRTLELGFHPLHYQDILDERETSMGLPSGARVRATVLDACRPKVRVGSASTLEFYPDAVVPVPKKRRLTRWIQLEGCEDVLPRPSRGGPPNP